jgi:hypothetical protein
VVEASLWPEADEERRATRPSPGVAADPSAKAVEKRYRRQDADHGLARPGQILAQPTALQEQAYALLGLPVPRVQ